MKKQNMRKELIVKFTVCGVAILFAAIVLILYLAVLKEKPVEGQKNVSLIIQYQNKEYNYENLTTEELYVLDFLIEYNEKLELDLIYETSAFGAYITSLKGTEQDNQKYYYYTYTINGEYADGISVQPIKDGDIIKFAYAYEGEFDENGDWVSVEPSLMAGGNNTRTSLPKEYDVMLISVIIIVCALVVSSIAYIGVILIKERRRK